MTTKMGLTKKILLSNEGPDGGGDADIHYSLKI